MRNWTTEEIEFLTARLNLPTKEIYLQFCGQYGADNLSRTYNSVQKKIQKLQEALAEDQPEGNEYVDFSSEDYSPGGSYPGVPLSSAVDLAAEQLAADAINLLQQPGPPFIPYVTTAQKKDSRESVRDWLNEVIKFSKEELGDNMASVVSSQPVDSDKSSLVVVLSDTHLGKQTPGFNLEIARKRALSIPETIYARNTQPVDEVVVALVGDMIEGEDIYATQNSHVEVPVIDQAVAAAETFWQVALSFRRLFKCPVRVETCPGNHGRMSKTANEKSNWDNVVYHILRVMAQMYGDENVVVNCNFNEFRTFPVKDKIGLLYHKGVPHTGTPSMQLKIAGWFVNKQFDFLLHGHWHEWHVGQWLGRVVVGNGCMCGPDDLAERMGKEDSARQGYFYVTPGQPLHGFSFVEW